MTATDKPSKGFFITGSDTGVGKTWVSCQLIQQLIKKGFIVKTRKPVESGCDTLNGNYIPSDGEALRQANNCRENLDVITPYRFQAALAPDQAAKLEMKSITLDQLYSACISEIEPGDFLIVEGAGGFFSPIAEDGLNSDLAEMLGLEIIIVVEDRLGAINQALLTETAVVNRGLAIHSIVLNQNQNDTSIDNFEALKNRTRSNVIQCSFQGDLSQSIF